MKYFLKTIALALFLLNQSAAAHEMARPPNLKALAGAWIGPGNQVAYFRLELDQNGHGQLVIQEDSEDTVFSYYKVENTSITGYKITFQLSPLSGADPTIRLTGNYSGGVELELVRSGINNDGYIWSNPVRLILEDSVLPRIKAVQDASAIFPER